MNKITLFMLIGCAFSLQGAATGNVTVGYGGGQGGGYGGGYGGGSNQCYNINGNNPIYILKQLIIILNQQLAYNSQFKVELIYQNQNGSIYTFIFKLCGPNGQYTYWALVYDASCYKVITQIYHIDLTILIGWLGVTINTNPQPIQCPNLKCTWTDSCGNQQHVNIPYGGQTNYNVNNNMGGGFSFGNFQQAGGFNNVGFGNAQQSPIQSGQINTLLGSSLSS